MYDENLVDFYDRVARFEKAHAKGFGHEAAGTLGRSAYARPARRKRSVVAPMLFACLCAVGLKAAILHSVGPAQYQTRVERLNAGEGFDRLGGWLMQVDPVTARVAGWLDQALPGQK